MQSSKLLRDLSNERVCLNKLHLLFLNPIGN